MYQTVPWHIPDDSLDCTRPAYTRRFIDIYQAVPWHVQGDSWQGMRPHKHDDVTTFVFAFTSQERTDAMVMSYCKRTHVHLAGQVNVLCELRAVLVP